MNNYAEFEPRPSKFKVHGMKSLKLKKSLIYLTYKNYDLLVCGMSNT
jgi:hypothetical protein